MYSCSLDLGPCGAMVWFVGPMEGSLGQSLGRRLVSEERAGEGYRIGSMSRWLELRWPYHPIANAMAWGSLAGGI